jgi:hypothetical protein
MARKWESIISYEWRSGHLHTSRWRLSGLKTKEGAENTDSGVLWLNTIKSGNTVTCDLYKDGGLDASDLVATGSADVSSCDDTGTNAAEVTLSASNSSGLTGSLWIHNYVDDSYAPIQVALCTDEDMDSLWDGIEGLAGYDSTYGCAEFIRVASDDVIAKVTSLYEDKLGGYGTAEAWYIESASRYYPDLRRIANPAQLRLATAWHALEIAVGRSHQRGDITMYSDLRDYFKSEYQGAMSALVLTTKSGDGDDAESSTTSGTFRMSRV